MNDSAALELVRMAIWTTIYAAGPAVISAMVVGIIISLFQALTQIQEITLTFVPKIIMLLAVSILTAPFIGAVLYRFSEEVYSHISSGF